MTPLFPPLSIWVDLREPPKNGSSSDRQTVPHAIVMIISTPLSLCFAKPRSISRLSTPSPFSFPREAKKVEIPSCLDPAKTSLHPKKIPRSAPIPLQATDSPMQHEKNLLPSFEDLRCTKEDREKIKTIISTLAEAGVFELARKRSKLLILGEEIKPVHPLKFLSTLFSDPYLKKCMGIIFHDYNPLKKKRILSGIQEGMDRESPNVEPYLGDFAKKVGVAPEPLTLLIRTRGWELLVRYLLGEVSAQEILSSQG